VWILEDRFVISDDATPVGIGMAADVFKATDIKQSPPIQVAVKLFKKLPDLTRTRAAFGRELKTLMNLSAHNHVVEVIDHGVDEKTDRQFIVLEWCTNDLSIVVKNKSILGWDDFYERYGSQIIDAVSFAYDANVIHRDIKPSNVLLNSEDSVKVADFGIARYAEYRDQDLTFQSYGTAPYSPPERDSGDYEATKDVFGFAALALECVIGREIQNYEDLNDAFENEFDAPDEVNNLISRCIDTNPALRPANASELKDQLEAIHRDRLRHFVAPKVISLALTNKTRDVIRYIASVANDSEIESYIIEDLSNGIFVQNFRELDKTVGKWVDVPDHYLITGEVVSYHCLIPETGDRLLAITARPVEIGILERIQEHAWQPDDIIFSFELGRDRELTENNLEYFKQSLVDDIISRHAEERLKDAEGIFYKLDSILRCRESIEFSKEDPIKFELKMTEDNRVLLKTDKILDSDLSGQKRFVDLGKYKISGEIEAIEGDKIFFHLELGDPSEFPARGNLVLDTRASKQAIRRQKLALDAIRYGRAENLKVKELFLNPSISAPSYDPDSLLFLDKELDQDKKNAVLASLATDDFLIVEGPPGTGKTKFIAELVVQQIVKNPKSRILLSSQTHIALDNALERIRATTEQHLIDVRLVRIGNWGDKRISPKVQDLLLETSVKKWLGGVKRNSEDFLVSWARERDLSEKDVKIGIGLQRLRHARAELDYSQNAVDELSERLTVLENENASEIVQNSQDKYTKSQEDIQIVSEDLETAKQRLYQSRKSFTEAREGLSKYAEELGEEIFDYTGEDLDGLASDFIGENDDSVKLKRLIEIQDEWLDRFGRSNDFFGAYVSGAQVVAGTCLGFSSRGLQEVSYDLCIVDEASKATVNEVLVPISRSARWIIVGDSKQLPPFVDAAIQNRTALDEYDLTLDDIKQTIFDHLTPRLPEEKTLLLSKQYRMTAPIGELISHCFYNGFLENVFFETDETLQKAKAFLKPVTWFSTSRRPNAEEIPCYPSYKNLAEIDEIRNLLRRIEFAASAKGDPYSVAVMAGYEAQVIELDRMIANLSPSTPNLEISCHTVDSFQGRQADIAIYSVTRSNDSGKIGFLKEFSRLNVALSRGRIALGIVGNDLFCRSITQENPLADVLDYISRHPEDCEVYLGE
jgi:superfamily I DNA and/or RNA helicase/serine/threonine protein kinase